MLKNKTTRFVVIGAALLTVVSVAAVATAANAATQANGSQGKVYIGDGGTNALVPAGHVFGWTDDTFGFGDSANVSTPYVCPADATGSVTFLAPKGQEFTVANWSATGTSLFYPSNSKNVAQFTTSLYGQNTGNAAAVKASGGDFSVGLACTINNGTKLASSGVFFASVHITAVSGAYTVDQPTEDVATPPVTPPSGSQALNLKATTLAAQDGTLSLLAPASSTVLIGNPVLDPTTHLSVSTGKLGNITVADGRVVTHKGWDLTTSVSAFTLEGDSTKTIPAGQLGLAPKIVSKPTSSVVTAAAAQVAGSATVTSPFASADNSANVGNTIVDADLTFVAPATATAGTYDSTLTLTLTSK
jgi:hypothetical protein